MRDDLRDTALELIFFGRLEGNLDENNLQTSFRPCASHVGGRANLALIFRMASEELVESKNLVAHTLRHSCQ